MNYIKLTFSFFIALILAASVFVFVEPLIKSEIADYERKQAHDIKMKELSAANEEKKRLVREKELDRLRQKQHPGTLDEKGLESLTLRLKELQKQVIRLNKLEERLKLEKN